MQAVLLIVVGLGAVFVWINGASLPEVVASHFDASGAANGSTPRATYVGMMLLFVALLPLVLALVGRLVAVLPIHLVNLPNREFWLAPERKAATLKSVSALFIVLALLSCAFLCLVFWLTVRANAVQPAHLSTGAMTAALGVFVVATLAWMLVLWRRFKRVD